MRSEWADAERRGPLGVQVRQRRAPESAREISSIASCRREIAQDVLQPACQTWPGPRVEILKSTGGETVSDGPGGSEKVRAASAAARALWTLEWAGNGRDGFTFFLRKKLKISNVSPVSFELNFYFF